MHSFDGLGPGLKVGVPQVSRPRPLTLDQAAPEEHLLTSKVSHGIVGCVARARVEADHPIVSQGYRQAALEAHRGH
ncbi:MAG: hypothetical protein KC910_37235, partial [Candidatus Eremiobacteraeota bacterium]|nr:hypothetical protein [Candidatus Eremiobacteraeota bacterium]